jgi:Uma2 family endonuclease
MPVLLTPFADHEVEIPEWVTTNQTFLRWAQSKDAPEKGRYGFLHNQLWLDHSMETLFHNFIKSALYAALGTWVREKEIGDLLPDGMLLSVPKLDFTTQPDGMFVSFDSWSSGRVKVKKEDKSVVVFGSHDIVIEVVSPTTRRKDSRVLPPLYWKAQIREYWLIDQVEGEPVLKLFKRGSRKYTAVASHDGWLRSEAVEAEVQLVAKTVAGQLRYELLLREND